MNYWAKRALIAQQNASKKTIKQTEKQLRKYFSNTLSKTLGHFETTYNALLLSIGEGKTPTPADLYKLDKYWQLQAQLRQELKKLGDNQATALSKIFETHFFEVYYSFGLPGSASFTTLDSDVVQQLINQIWVADGKSWSERIWGNTEKLQQALNDSLVECVVAGRKTTELKNMLQEQFNVSYRRADALVRTEIAHIQTQATQKRYEDYGIQEVEVWADKDERRCEICGKLHQKRYRIDAKMPVPAHPNCRCCMIPVID